MKLVFAAKPFVPGCLDSLTSERGRHLIRQWRFPEWSYAEGQDNLLTADSDRLPGFRDCCRRWTGAGELEFERWIMDREREPTQVLDFLLDVLEVGVPHQWSGLRILGGVHPESGQIVWMFEVFYKHPRSRTKLLSNPPEAAVPFPGG